MNIRRIPQLSREGEAFFASILGGGQTRIDITVLSANQVEQLLIVLEEEIAHLSGQNNPAPAERIQELSKFAEALMKRAGV